jgi:hypothetical protein
LGLRIFASSLDDYACDRANESPEWVRWNKRYTTLSNLNDCDIAAAAQDPDNQKMRKLHNKFLEERYWIENQFFPLAGDYKWFQCMGAEHELAPWQKALAERIFPEYNWGIFEVKDKGSFFHITGIDIHSFKGTTIIGTHPEKGRMIFDLLRFETYSIEEILKDAGVLKMELVV